MKVCWLYNTTEAFPWHHWHYTALEVCNNGIKINKHEQTVRKVLLKTHCLDQWCMMIGWRRGRVSKHSYVHHSLRVLVSWRSLGRWLGKIVIYRDFQPYVHASTFSVYKKAKTVIFYLTGCARLAPVHIQGLMINWSLASFPPPKKKEKKVCVNENFTN